MATTVSIPSRLSQPASVALVRDWLRCHPEGSRWALGRYLCAELDIHDHRGAAQMPGVQQALRSLEKKGFWRLPSTGCHRPRQWNARRLNAPVPVPASLPERVDKVHGLGVVLVRTSDDSQMRVWNELMLTEHPLHECRLVGRQLRYLLVSRDGPLGGFGFGSSVLRLGPRDRWIGWDAKQREQNVDRITGMARFLIRPVVQCQNLASWALGACMRRLADDYEQEYGIRPLLVESFVDEQAHDGACYQAANWTRVGQTQGVGLVGRGPPSTSRKGIYMYALDRHWRRALGLPSPAELVRPVDVQEVLSSDTWAADEFGGCDFGDRRLTDRLISIVQCRARDPSVAFTASCNGDRHQLKGVYRWIDHPSPRIQPSEILHSHRERTIGRMVNEKCILLVQDTTELDFSKRLRCNGLGDIGTNQTGQVSHGLDMHSTLAFSGTGLPLGVWDTNIFGRHFSPPGHKPNQNRPIEEKDSGRWLDSLTTCKRLKQLLPTTEIISVTDREGDFFEFFDHQRRKVPAVHLLVRAQHNRTIADIDDKLFEHLDRLPAMALVQIHIPRQRATAGTSDQPAWRDLPARTADIELRWTRITLRPPMRLRAKGIKDLRVNVLHVHEPHPPTGARPIHWILLTTLPIDTRTQALRCLRYYQIRWRIEVWHRILKSTCHIEAHQHQTAERLARAATIDAVIAFRILLLTMLGRTFPDLPADIVLPPLECHILSLLQPTLAPETSARSKKGRSQ